MTDAGWGEVEVVLGVVEFVVVVVVVVVRSEQTPSPVRKYPDTHEAQALSPSHILQLATHGTQV